MTMHPALSQPSCGISLTIPHRRPSLMPSPPWTCPNPSYPGQVSPAIPHLISSAHLARFTTLLIAVLARARVCVRHVTPPRIRRGSLHARCFFPAWSRVLCSAFHSPRSVFALFSLGPARLPFCPLAHTDS
ncbi:hypothetical protein BD310DRAFT_920490 [Dichomitus squalens]|uniref:Uncharacterized protein n=1 Tax=Dichomitus squalens TaxID=114155 RepID=A0A4Q9Q3D9_9APHY|nr:hypothetical protein BD310DRAFT_920490 [Dichomitus squalens]